MIELLSNNVSPEDILSYCSEHDIYGIYVGYKCPIGKRIISPIRAEGDPSFALFYAGDRLLFKDHSSAKHGDVFQFVREYLRIHENVLLSFPEVLKRICKDVVRNKVYSTYPTKIKTIDYVKSDIKVVTKPYTERGLAYWNRFLNLPNHELKAYLEYHRVYELKSRSDIGIFFSDITFGYRIGYYWKIYQPYAEKDYKFRNNYPRHFIEGWAQLRGRDTIIITKSKKDVMFLDRIGIDSISPKSETTILPEKAMDIIDSKYKHKYVLFDNDGKHNGSEYPWPMIQIPKQIAKDPTDAVIATSFKETKDLIYGLL